MQSTQVWIDEHRHIAWFSIQYVKCIGITQSRPNESYLHWNTQHLGVIVTEDETAEEMNLLVSANLDFHCPEEKD